MSFDADEFETDEVSMLERRPPDRDRDRFWIRNAIIEDIRQDRDLFYVTVRYRAQGQGQGRGPDRDFDRNQDQGRGRDQDRDRDMGPGMGRDGDRDRDNRRPQMQTVRLIVGRQTRIVNMNGREVRPDRLQLGMRIDALISEAMTRSIPPQARAFQILLLEQPPRTMTTNGRIIQIDNRGQFIIVASQGNPNNLIRFNIDRNTEIYGPDGRRIRLQNLFPGLRVRIEHATFMTASIPPQTAAFVIRVVI